MTVHASTGGGLPLPGVDNVSNEYWLPPKPAAAPRILFIEQLTTESGFLKTRIGRATLWAVVQVATLADGLNYLLGPRKDIAIVVFAIDHGLDLATRFIQTINELGASGTIARRPLLLALTIKTQSAEFAARLDKFGVPLLLRKCPDQIVETIKKLQFQAKTTRGMPTIIIERRGGRILGVEVSYQGINNRLRIGPRLCLLAAYLVIHRKTEHSTEALANALGISLPSVKEYLKRLRHAYDLLYLELGSSLRGKDVFWTKRMPGGFLHGLRANAEIEDLDEFYFPEEDRYDMAAVLPCHLCRRRNPRSETTWSHTGWTCRECAEKLTRIREF
jgi:hypothetical protein